MSTSPANEEEDKTISPAQAHDYLDRIQEWDGKYLTITELATMTLTADIGRRGKNSRLYALPFHAERWLDEPQDGADGAKTWDAMRATLDDWAQTLTETLQLDPADTWDTLHAAIDEMLYLKHDDLPLLLDEIGTIWKRIRRNVEPAAKSYTCPKCGNPTFLKYGVKGWDEKYTCKTCRIAWKFADLYTATIQKIARSDQWIDIAHALAAFPGLTPDRLWQWAHRGQIEVRKNKKGRNLYQASQIRENLL